MRRRTQNVFRASVVLSTLLALSSLSGCGKDQSSASLLADAKQYQQKGDHKAALIQLKNAASNSPEDSQVRLELAHSYIETGDPVSAEKEIRKAMSLGIDRARTLPVLAKSLLMQGKAQEALDASNNAGALANADLLTTRGNAFAALNDAVKSAESYEAALVAKPGTAGALTGLARLAMVRKDTAAANSYIEQALAANPKDPAVWMFKGTMLRALGKPEEAVAAYSESIKLKPDLMNSLVERAQLQIDAGKFEAAQADLTAARKAVPNALVITHTQALLYFKQGKFAEAKESLQQVTKQAPNFMPAVLLSGAVDLNLGAFQQAEQSLNRYVTQFPENAYARKLLAQTMLQSARPADAAATLAPLLKDGSQDSQLMALAGMTAAQTNDPVKASSYFEQASALNPNSAALRTSLGMAKMNSGNAEAGLSQLEKAVELNPASIDAIVALVRAQMALKQLDKALVSLAKAEKSQSNNGQFYNLKGAVLLAKGDAGNARASFDKAATLQPTEFAPVKNLAQLDLQQKNPTAAKKRIEGFLEKNKKHVEAMFALAELAGIQGQKTEAAAWLEKAVAENPDAAAPALRLGSYYLANNQNEKALTLARKARAAAPNSTELADLLGQAQIASKDFSAALETYTGLAKAAPKSAMAQMRLARVHMLLKDNGAAADDLKRAVAMQPDYMPARLAQVELAARSGKPDDALSMARKMQTQFPTSPVGYAVEGDIYQQTQRPAQALLAYEKALTISKSPPLMLKLADLMRRTGKAKEAETRLVQWLKVRPADDGVRSYLAEMNLANKQYKAAAIQFDELLKRNPDNVLVLNNLAWVYQQEKDARALPTAERAVKLAPENPAVLDTLGWMLAEQGNTGRALPLLKKAVAAAPEAREIRYHLAAALHKSGDKSSARKELDKLLGDNKPFAGADEAKALSKSLD